MSAVTGDELDGRLTRDKLQRALAAICAEVGLHPADAELIKFTNNAVFRLTTAPVVVRIAGSSAVRDRIGTVVQVAAWLAEQDVPAVHLWPDIGQPVTAAACGSSNRRSVRSPPATTWPLCCCASMHCQRHPFPCRRGLRSRRSASGWPSPRGCLRTTTLLLRRCDELEAELEDVRYVLPVGIIHGDPFLGNLIPGSEGPVLCDFDSTCIGPREWDLTPVAVGKLRFNYPHDEYSLVAARYGFDVTTWHGFPVLRRIRELKLVTSGLSCGATPTSAISGSTASPRSSTAMPQRSGRRTGNASLLSKPAPCTPHFQLITTRESSG